MTRTLRAPVALTFALALLLAMAMPASAQTQQEGLVNVDVSDVTVQLPIAVAANVCDVAVNVLAEQVRDGGAECDSEAESGATVPWNGGNGDGGTQQDGLVNVNVEDIVIQAPIGLAANICDVAVNVLAQQERDGGADCDAEAMSDAA